MICGAKMKLQVHFKLDRMAGQVGHGPGSYIQVVGRVKMMITRPCRPYACYGLVMIDDRDDQNGDGNDFFAFNIFSQGAGAACGAQLRGEKK